MRKYCAFALFCIFTNVWFCHAQDGAVKPISIGDRVPMVELRGVLNDSATHQLADLYESRDLLIIDFWATWCTPCIKAFPKLGEIKTHFGNRVEVVAATYEQRDKIENFFERNPDKLAFGVKFIVGDTLLAALFPHRVIPHVVWIDGDGDVLATTDTEELTLENIELVLEGGADRLITKVDVFDFDITANMPVGDDNFLFRSVLTNYKPGVNGIGRTEPVMGITELDNHDDRKIKREIHLNTPIEFLYMYAAYGGRFLKMNKHMVELEIKDSVRVVHPMSYDVSNSDQYRSLSHWRQENSYCYELIVPQLTPAPEFYQYMMEDLNRYFNVYGSIEKRWRDCYVITNRNKESKHLFSSYSKTEAVVEPETKFTKAPVITRINHITMDKFVRLLNQNNLGLPIFNETVNKVPLDLEIGMPITRESLDMDRLRTKLLPQGFDIIRTKRLIDLLVIRDK